MTFLDILEAVKTVLMDNIGVFDKGYAYARLDSSKGLVATAGNNAKYVGINDTEGNYFYIRVPEKISSNVSKNNLTDCGSTLLQKYPCSLVAVVTEADEFELTDAIVNELTKATRGNIEVKAIWIDPISIINEEFKGMDKKSIEAAKARVGERIIVRVDFDVIRLFNTHSCAYNICKPCSN